MPASSEKQRRAAGAALSAKQGGVPTSRLQGSAKGMYESMTEEQLKDFARKPRPTRHFAGITSHSKKHRKSHRGRSKK